ncbi:MAG: haloacid dehalogenase type II [Halobacteria archaeon]|nr:haloacid dehalogenase type II [Halobacteria archaeon]
MTRQDEALCFDMYGTLCDTSSVREEISDVFGITESFGASVDELWRRKQLQYSYQSAQMGEYETFWEITSKALDYSVDFYSLDASSDETERLMEAYDSLDPFPDSLDALDSLSDGYRLAVLSNGNPDMLERLAENTGIDGYVDDIISADEVSDFKPSPVVYENAADRLDRQIGNCRLVSSNAWDIAGASQAGMATAWVNRKTEPEERVGGEPDLVVESLSDLAEELTS